MGAQLSSTMKNILLPTVELDNDDEKTSWYWWSVRTDLDVKIQFVYDLIQAKKEGADYVL